MAPDAVIRLVERTRDVGAGIGQREPVARAPVVLREAQHCDAVALDGLDRNEMLHVEPMRHLEEETFAVLVLSRRRQGCPGGIFDCRAQGRRVGRLVVEPPGNHFGKAPLPGEHPCPRVRNLAGAEMRFQRLAQRVAIERGGSVFLYFLDRAALYEEALYRVKRRKLVVSRLQIADFSVDAEQRSEKIFEVRREIDDEIGLSFAVERGGVGARGHHPVVQRRVASREMGHKGTVELDEPVALVELGECQPVFERDISHCR